MKRNNTVEELVYEHFTESHEDSDSFVCDSNYFIDPKTSSRVYYFNAKAEQRKNWIIPPCNCGVSARRDKAVQAITQQKLEAQIAKYKKDIERFDNLVKVMKLNDSYDEGRAHGVEDVLQYLESQIKSLESQLKESKNG